MDEARAKTIIQEEDVEVSVELGMGSEEARYWTCDFSHVGLLRVITKASSTDIATGICDNQRIISKLDST